MKGLDRKPTLFSENVGTSTSSANCPTFPVVKEGFECKSFNVISLHTSTKVQPVKSVSAWRGTGTYFIRSQVFLANHKFLVKTDLL